MARLRRGIQILKNPSRSQSVKLRQQEILQLHSSRLSLGVWERLSRLTGAWISPGSGSSGASEAAFASKHVKEERNALCLRNSLVSRKEAQTEAPAGGQRGPGQGEAPSARALRRRGSAVLTLLLLHSGNRV